MMIRYVTAAAALKLFSAGPLMRGLYRQLGNVGGARQRIRQGLPSSYVERALRFKRLCEEHGAIGNGMRLLELGTGWAHWESTFIRLFYDVEAALFDVWDNRQLEAFQCYFGELEAHLDGEIELDAAASPRAHDLLRAIAAASTFDELYRLLGFQYVVDPGGSLRHFEDGSFDLVFSFNVLEHVQAGILSQFTLDMAGLLKPGGYAIHQIDLGDHLAYYDPAVSVKNYLRYSDTAWKRCFENEVQYFNRVQRPEWLHLFQSAGLVLVEEHLVTGDIGGIAVDGTYAHLDRQDLGCTALTVVYRKPRGA